MVKSGSFTVGQGSLAGRLGSGLGKGLAEQLPKEFERERLKTGLEQFAKESSNMSPLEQATKLFGIPGITPQMVQVLPELLKQQQLGQSLKDQSEAENRQRKFDLSLNKEESPEFGLTTRPGQEALRKGYIPPTMQQIDKRAGELYNSNPQRFKNNPENAIAYAQSEAAQEQVINQAYQNQRRGQQDLQKSVQGNLQTQAGLLGAKVPGTVYSDIEQRAIKSILPVEEGGESLTEDEAKIKYGNKLDQVSREYNALRGIGGWALISKSPSENLRAIKSARSQFAKRDDLQNFADTLIDENGLSPSKAYYLAFPNSEIPELSKSLKKIPDVNQKKTLREEQYEKEYGYNPEVILNQMAPKLAKDMGKTGSPLAIAEEIYSKGYDPSTFLRYLDENKEKLDLSLRQVNELTKPRNFVPTMDDLWLFKLSGQDKIVE
jgi:hypothetical protein